jgi:hypothetical protein
MSDRTEISVGDETERLFAAVVGMHPPSDIGQQASGMTQAAIFLGFPQFYDPHQTIGPVDQFFRMACESRQQLVERPRGANQPVLRAFGLRQHRVEQAFTHSEGRKYDGLRLCDPDDVFENKRRIGQQRPPCIGDDFDIGQHVCGREAAKAAREIERVRCRYRIAVHHTQRITALTMWMRASARRFRRPHRRCVPSRLELGNLRQIVPDDALGALQRLVG